MVLTCIGTGSKGNSYVLRNSKHDVLLIELGCKPSTIFYELNKLGVTISDISGAIYTHCHGDHNYKVAKNLKCSDYFRSLGIKVQDPESLELGKSFNYGDFKITPLPAEHDVYCVSYLIECDNEKVLFATDTNALVKVGNIRIGTFIVEVNYVLEMMNRLLEEQKDFSDLDIQAMQVAKRHLSLESLCTYFDNLGYEPKQILTIHASSRRWFSSSLVMERLAQYVEDSTCLKVVKNGGSYGIIN